MKVCVVILMMGSFATADLFDEEMYKDAMQVVHECRVGTFSMCLKEKALKFIERLPNNIDMGNGIRITENDSARLSREYAPLNLPEEPREREEELDRVLWQRLADYFSSHTIEFKIPMAPNTYDVSAEEARKKGGGGGKKGGKKGGMMPLMMMFGLKAATLGALALKFLALLAFKALLMAKVALTISAIIALKKLVETKHHSSTYEVVAHPHIDDYSHYDRAFRENS